MDTKQVSQRPIRKSKKDPAKEIGCLGLEKM